MAAVARDRPVTTSYSAANSTSGRPLPAGDGFRDGADANNRLRLLIADHQPTRLGIRMALGGLVEVCAEAANPHEAIQAAMHHRPQLCFIGREVMGEGVGAVRGLCRAAPDAAVVVLAEVGDAEEMIDLVREGAVGYVPGPVDAERLRRIVRAVASNEAVVPRAMILDLLMELRCLGGRSDALTGRESQVLGLVRRGHGTSVIAERLSIAPVTVRRHISELVQKLGVEDRAALADARPGKFGSTVHADQRAVSSR